MKRLIVLVVLGLSLASCLAFAGGDKNHGETGTGSTVVGTEAPGEAVQPRTGR